MAKKDVAPAKGKIIGVPYQGTHTLGNWESDNAVDVSLPYGTPVFAPFSGTIGPQFGLLDSGNGRFAGIRMHVVGKNNEAYLAHLSAVAQGIAPGVEVKEGQVVGFSGSASGVNHLHFAVEKGDPRSFYAAGDMTNTVDVPNTTSDTNRTTTSATSAQATQPTVTQPIYTPPPGSAAVVTPPVSTAATVNDQYTSFASRSLMIENLWKDIANFPFSSAESQGFGSYS